MSNRPKPTGHPGRPGRAQREEQVRAALAHLDDAIWLADSSRLTDMPSVRLLTETEFKGRTCAAGLALRMVLRRALAQIAGDLDEMAVGVLAKAFLDGRSQAAAADELRISDEHLCRRWKPVLVRLVNDHLERMNERALVRTSPGNGAERGAIAPPSTLVADALRINSE